MFLFMYHHYKADVHFYSYISVLCDEKSFHLLSPAWQGVIGQNFEGVCVYTEQCRLPKAPCYIRRWTALKSSLFGPTEHEQLMFTSSYYLCTYITKKNLDLPPPESCLLEHVFSF